MVNPDRARRPAGGRAYGGLSPEDRAAARRQRLVDAGISAFGRDGLRGSTVRGICREAGLTDRYFYESFDTLEILLQAVYQTLTDRLRQALGAAIAAVAHEAATDAAIEQRFRRGYEVWFGFVSDPAHARIVLAEVLGVSDAVDRLYEAGMSGFARLLEEPLAAAGADLAERPLLARALVGAAVQVARGWSAGGYAEPRGAVVETCVIVAMGTVHRLQARGKVGGNADVAAARPGRARRRPSPAGPPVSAPARRASRR